MGNWSETIMGGDGPWDAQYEVFRLACFDDQDNERNYEDHLPELKELLERVSPDAWSSFFADGDSESWTADKKRVAAVMLMECGAALPDMVKAAALDACENDPQDWRDPTAREFYLNQFAQAIKDYDGTPTVLPSEGLFDVLARGQAGVGKSSKP